MSMRILWAFGLAILLVVVARTVADWESGRAGQVVFRPVPLISGEGSDVFGDLVITGCHRGEGGLVVSGSVSPGPSPRVVLATTGVPDTDGGHRVAMAYQAQTQVGAVVGDFVIFVPWANVASSFALAGDTSGALSPHGPLVRCP